LIEEDLGEEEVEFKPDQVLAAMHELSPAYRTIFNLYVFENLTHKEIADKLDISVGTSKSNLAKAKRNLAKILRNGTH
jgi:RNA polymerase sigma-70 factor (ECF subfamily)